MPGTTQVLETLLQRCDDAVALCLHDRDREVLRWSFRELQEARHYCGQELLGVGLQRGDRILLLCSDVPQLLAILFAALELELCLLPVHPDQDLRCLEDIVQTQKPVLAIVDGSARTALTQLRSVVPDCFTLELSASQWLQRWQALPVATALPAVAVLPAAAASDADGRADCAVVFHSSGSTGVPKALYYTRVQLDTFLEWQQRLFAPFDDEAPGSAAAVPTPRINVLPLTHWGGLSFCLQALSEGRAVHLFKVFHPDPLLQLIERCGCRLLMLVPSMVREMLQRLQQQCPPSLRYCLTMGEALPVSLATALRRHHGLLLCTAYGMSEALSGLAHGGVPLDEVPHGSCGQQAFGDIRLVSSDGVPQPQTGEAEGEMWVRNATTRPCYRDPLLLRAKYVDGWYRTGDCFRRDVQGHYYFQSRVDAMCVHNGRNVYPQQVEAVFIEHPSVQACVAAPLYMPDGRQRLGVWIVLAEGVEVSSHELLDYYLQHGAHYAAPVFMLLSDSVPATWSGKPERVAISALLQAAHDADGIEAGLIPKDRGRQGAH